MKKFEDEIYKELHELIGKDVSALVIAVKANSDEEIDVIETRIYKTLHDHIESSEMNAFNQGWEKGTKYRKESEPRPSVDE